MLNYVNLKKYIYYQISKLKNFSVLYTLVNYIMLLKKGINNWRN